MTINAVVGDLIREEEISELDFFINNFPKLSSLYIPVGIIGEGTFSTVYKAIDVEHYKKDNSAWIHSNRQDPDDLDRILNLISKRKRRSNTHQVYNLILQYLQNHYSNDIERIKKEPPQMIAIKRINPTSGPKRIAEELSFLATCNGSSHVVPIISAHRHEDQILIVFPFFNAIDFRDLLPKITILDIKNYMKLLLKALAHVHTNGIIHRDIKPSNFMFNPPNGAILVDFGLAQFADDASFNPNKRYKIPPHSSAKLKAMMEKLPDGLLQNDSRAPMRASRAGTRGFRAPEVLFKQANQTASIDIWSSGVIMLTMLARRYPFFQSSDDQDAIVELACIFGQKEMADIAKLYNRIWKCSVSSVPEERIEWPLLIDKLGGMKEIPLEAYDLLDRLLCLDSKKRITANEALDHVFLSTIN